MPTNIAGVIQGDRQMRSQELGQVAQTANQTRSLNQADEALGLEERNVSLKENAMKMQMQGIVDQKAGAYLTVVNQKNMQVASAQKSYDEAVAASDNFPGRKFDLSEEGKQANKLWVFQKQAAEEAVIKAQTSLDEATNGRNNIITSLINTPGAMLALRESSMADQYLIDQMFNEDTFASMGEAERTENVARMTALHVAMKQNAAAQAQADAQMAGREAYYVEAGKQAAQGQESVARSTSDLGFKTYFADLQRQADVVGKGTKISENQARAYWDNDIATFQYAGDQLQNMPESDKRALGNEFKKYNSTADLVAWRSNFLENTANLQSDLANEIRNKINGLDSKHGHTRTRMSQIIDKTKGYTLAGERQTSAETF